MPNELKPMDAWRIILASLFELYEKRRTKDFNGYGDADIRAAIICFRALKEMEERERADNG